MQGEGGKRILGKEEEAKVEVETKKKEKEGNKLQKGEDTEVPHHKLLKRKLLNSATLRVKRLH